MLRPYNMHEVLSAVPTPFSGLVIAMVVSLIFIVLLRFLAGIMIWVMIILVILVIAYGTCPASVGAALAFHSR